ncbi:MAG: domain superfamily [Nitrospirae bacterium]|nr:domain superfamily [Nitrospirota bacterium]
MAIYIALSTLTDDGRKTLKNNPGRIKEVNREIEGMGIKILGQYAVLGSYDFVTLIEAPNNEAVMKMSVELGSRGSVQLMTLPALSVDDFIASLK